MRFSDRCRRKPGRRNVRENLIELNKSKDPGKETEREEEREKEGRGKEEERERESACKAGTGNRLYL